MEKICSSANIFIQNSFTNSFLKKNYIENALWILVNAIEDTVVKKKWK